MDQIFVSYFKQRLYIGVCGFLKMIILFYNFITTSIDLLCILYQPDLSS